MSESSSTLGLETPSSTTSFPIITSSFVTASPSVGLGVTSTATASITGTFSPQRTVTASFLETTPSAQGITTSLPVCYFDGTVGPCPTGSAQAAVSTIFISEPFNDTSQLSATTIVGIVFAALALLLAVGTGLWVYRRKAASRPQRILPYIHERDGKPGDRSSIISGRSAGSMRSARSACSVLSLWSTFGNRQQNLNIERNNSVEDGVRVEIDTVQVVEEPYSPMTVPPTGVALFTPRRTTRQWTGYGVSGNRLADDTSDIFNPSTIISSSSIPEEETEVEFPTHLIAKPDLDPSPFSDAYDVKASPVDTLDTNSGTGPSEHDAAQLSQRDLEALADIVAARLNRRVDFSPASEYTHPSPKATDLPPRYV